MSRNLHKKTLAFLLVNGYYPCDGYDRLREARREPPPAREAGRFHIMDKLINLFAALGWAVAPPSLSRSMGSALLALASFEVPGATWRIRVGVRVSTLERRAHGTPTGRCSAGHWEAVGSVDTPRTLRAWRDMADALTGEALAFESTVGIPLTRLRSGSQQTRRGSADGSDTGGTTHGRGRVGRSNPSRLDAFGFAPAAGYRLSGIPVSYAEAWAAAYVDDAPECDLKAHRARVGLTAEAKRVAARKARRNARRKAQRKAAGMRN